MLRVVLEDGTTRYARYSDLEDFIREASMDAIREFNTKSNLKEEKVGE